MIYLQLGFSVKKEYNLTYKFVNGDSTMSIEIFSSEPAERFQIVIRINDYHYIVTPKNESAKKDFSNWFKQTFNKEYDFDLQSIPKMKTLISNKTKFDLVSDRRQAYKEYLKIRFNRSYTFSTTNLDHPPRPSKDFELLKEWYFQIWELAKIAKQNTIDTSPQALDVLEIEYIKNKINEIDRIYLPELLPVGPSGEKAAEIPYTSEKGTNIAFKKWLIERKLNIEKKPSEIIEPPPHVIKQHNHIKDDIDIFLDRIANESIERAHKFIDALAKEKQIQISTREQKLGIYKAHLLSHQQSIQTALYNVSKGGELYDIVKNALERKKVFKDSLYRAWVDCNTDAQVYKEIELVLSKNFTDFFIAFHLSATVDSLSGKYENWVKNEEFVKGKIKEGFIQGPPQYFVITKGKEERKLTVDEYIDALLFNWQNAIDKQNDYDNKLSVLNNARNAFSTIKYHYPVENKIEKVEERLGVVEKNINYYKDKKGIKTDEPKVEKTKSYTWTGERKKLQSMYRELKDSLIIPKETDINTFLYIFTGKPENAIIEPITWLKSNRLLAYMLFVLHSNNKITNKNWQSIAGKGKFFINKSEKSITTNDLAKAVSDCNKFEIKPQGADSIDTLLSVVIS